MKTKTTNGEESPRPLTKAISHQLLAAKGEYQARQVAHNAVSVIATLEDKLSEAIAALDKGVKP